jgi:hypothetical protein
VSALRFRNWNKRAALVFARTLRNNSPKQAPEGPTRATSAQPETATPAAPVAAAARALVASGVPRTGGSPTVQGDFTGARAETDRSPRMLDYAAL